MESRLEYQLDASLDLMRRMPPQQVSSNISDLIDVVPELCEDLLASTDQPLMVARDKITDKDYLLCNYNRDGDSYSCMLMASGQQHRTAEIDDGAVPSDELRSLEILANQVFDKYREIYFEGGLCSVYLWDLDNGFAGVILLKKAGTANGEKIKACWDSIHVFEVQEKGRSGHYKLTSTIMLWLQSIEEASGMNNLGGSLTRQIEEDDPINFENAHVHNIARMVEKMENKMRLTLYKVYFERTNGVISSLRSPERIKGDN